MKYLLSILIILGCSQFILGQELANFVPPSNFDRGTALARAPGALLWNFQLFVVGPRNAKLFGEEVDKAKNELKPGETAKYYLVGEVVGNTAIFRYLERVGRPVLRKGTERTIGIIELGKSRYALKPGPLWALSKDEFAELKKQLKDSQLTFADHCFGTEALNALNGYSVNATDKVKALQLLAKVEWKDLLEEDRRARAVADGTVILVAHANEDTYRVYDADMMQLDKKAYPKGEYVKSLGNTVWLYSKTASGEEYTTIYSNLGKIDVKLGQQTERAETVLGQWETLATPAVNWSIWRVHGPGQRFLRDVGTAKPYCVLPAQ